MCQDILLRFSPSYKRQTIEGTQMVNFCGLFKINVMQSLFNTQ